ncbi:MAG: rod shape-determining protein RodA [Candidatus Eremiobacteraeota bacterium]|nr:rod shape-determining protein RodA [Candidatus Eremiobacteraeota bacterium]
MAVLALGSDARRYVRNFNWSLAVACILVSALGVLCIQSADLHAGGGPFGEYKKQIIYVLLGIPLMLGFSFIDYRNWQRWAPGLYVVNLALLAFILRGGHSALGAQRWIAVGSFFTFQPSEAAKLILAISIAAVLCKSTYDRVQDLWKPLLTAAIPALLILKQPDLGTSLVIGAILTSQLFFGLPKLGDFLIYIMGVVIAGAAAVGTNAILKPFQKARLLVFLNPSSDPQGAGYNLNQSKIAVGNGEWFGRGLHHGTQTQLNFVPEHSRDFIFTVLAEELGFAGAALLLVLYAIVLYGGIKTMISARDRFGFLLAAGLVAMLFFHMLVNIGMTIGIMPITGIPLPFMSYGGSAVLTDFAAVGVLLNIYSQKDREILGNA